jgi:hypothetical protein
VADTRLAEINQVAATTSDDPELDTLILRLHTETACRRGGALALRPADLDPGYAVARRADSSGDAGAPSTYVRANSSEVAVALAAPTGNLTCSLGQCDPNRPVQRRWCG